jgi:hypothetical protein
MPAWITRNAVPAVWRRIPWRMVWAVALWLGAKGRDRVKDNLTQKEQHELWQLIKKSKGRPSALPQRDRTRVRNIARKAIRGS